MKLPGSTEDKIIKYNSSENVPKLETTEVVLLQYNILNNGYLRDSWVLSRFVPNKSFEQVLNISPTKHIYIETFCLQFSYIKVSFIDQNSRPLKIEARINLILVNDRGI